MEFLSFEGFDDHRNVNGHICMLASDPVLVF